MKVVLFAVLMLFNMKMSIGQIENTQNVLARNKVLSEIEKTCIGSCSGKYSKFDKKGNLIEWNFFRLGTLYRYKYNQNGNKIMTLSINKIDTTKVDTIYENTKIKKQDIPAFAEYSKDGHKSVEYTDSEIITSFFDKNCNLVERIHKRKGEIIIKEIIKYDDEQRIIEEVTFNQQRLKSINRLRGYHHQKPLEAFIERYLYNSKNQVIEMYTYFSDPCMGLDNHFLYVYNYHQNGLLESAQVYENGEKLAFVLEYEYEFYE